MNHLIYLLCEQSYQIKLFLIFYDYFSKAKTTTTKRLIKNLCQINEVFQLKIILKYIFQFECHKYRRLRIIQSYRPLK